MTEKTKQTSASAWYRDRGFYSRQAAAFAPVAIYLPIAAVEGGWGEHVIFWWMCWMMLLNVHDNAKRIRLLCAESRHLESIAKRALWRGAMLSLAVTALLIVAVLLFVYIPVPDRIYEMPLFLFPLVFGVCQERLLRRLRKISRSNDRNQKSIDK